MGKKKRLKILARTEKKADKKAMKKARKANTKGR
jgi:hypothetical protein